MLVDETGPSTGAEGGDDAHVESDSSLAPKQGEKDYLTGREVLDIWSREQRSRRGAPPPTGNDDEDDEDGEKPVAGDAKAKQATQVTKSEPTEADSQESAPPLKTDAKALVAQIQAMTPEEFRDTVAAHPFVAKQLKSIREADVRAKANEIAGPVVEQLETELSKQKSRADKAEEELDKIRMAAMTPQQRETYQATKRAERAEAAIEDLRDAKTRADDEAALTVLTQQAVKEYGLTEEQAEEIARSSRNISQWTDKVLKAAAKNLADARTAAEEAKRTKQVDAAQAAKDAAKERVKSGATVTAATAKSSPGVARTFDQIERAWLANPHDLKAKAEYNKARAARMGPFGGR